MVSCVQVVVGRVLQRRVTGYLRTNLAPECAKRWQCCGARTHGVEMAVMELSQAQWPRRLLVGMSTRQIVGFLGAAVVAMGALLSAPMPSASAQPCPDVEVVFARGTYEPPGVGATGQAFVDALRSQLGPKSLGVYAVDYPASGDFGDRIQFARTVVDGISDASTHVEATAANCPNTKTVLGGYSQGAIVGGFVTAAEVPEAIPAEYRSSVPNPMPPEVADHVAAVALFGMPSDEFLRDVDAPALVIGPQYVDKTIKLCAPGDTICDGAPAGLPSPAHGLYGTNGMVNEAAAFAAGRVSQASAAPAPPAGSGD